MQGAQARGARWVDKKKLGHVGRKLAKKIPRTLQDFDFSKVELKNVSDYAPRIRLALMVLAIFLLAELAARTAGLFIRPTYPTFPKRPAPQTMANQAPE